MNRDELRLNAARLVVAKVVVDKLTKFQRELRERTEPEMIPGEKVKATLPDGTPVGNVQLTEQSKRIKCDIVQVTNWVKQHRPDQIQENVADAYLAHLFELAKKYGHAFDKESGEVIPGIETVDGAASFRVTPSAEGRSIIEQRYSGVLELPDAGERPE